MQEFEFNIFINFKKGVIDPEAKAVEKVLKRKNYLIEKVKFSKVINLKVKAKDFKKAEFIVNEIAYNILTNPVLEDYKISYVKNQS